MLAFVGDSETLQIVLSSVVDTNELPFVCSYVEMKLEDMTVESFAQSNGTTDGTTEVTVVGSPADGSVRQLKFLSVYNADVEAAEVTLRFDDGTSARTLLKVELQVGEILHFTDSRGFYVLDSNGSRKSLVDFLEHSLAGSMHTSSSLAELNAKVSDATLDDASDTRDPKVHGDEAHSESYSKVGHTHVVNDIADFPSLGTSAAEDTGLTEGSVVLLAAGDVFPDSVISLSSVTQHAGGIGIDDLSNVGSLVANALIVVNAGADGIESLTDVTYSSSKLTVLGHVDAIGYYLDVYNIGDVDTTQDVDWSESNVQELTLTGSTTLTFTDPPSPCHLTLRISQDAVGSHTITWPSGIYWEGGSAPTLTGTAESVDVVFLLFNGTNYYAWSKGDLKTA